MFIAGLSEFLLIASLVFAAIKYPCVSPGIRAIYHLTLATTLSAALMGALRYLEVADTLFWHKAFSFASKHLGMAGFIGISLLSICRTTLEKQIIFCLMAIATCSFVVNIFASYPILSDAVIILLLGFGVHLFRSNMTAATLVVMATAILLSTLLWGGIIHDENIRLGVFHVCLSLFIVLFSQGVQHERTASVSTSAQAI